MDWHCRFSLLVLCLRDIGFSSVASPHVKAKRTDNFGSHIFAKSATQLTSISVPEEISKGTKKKGWKIASVEDSTMIHWTRPDIKATGTPASSTLPPSSTPSEAPLTLLPSQSFTPPRQTQPTLDSMARSSSIPSAT
ncbi:hypothetical protein M9H77_19272 [Catharanthus roseus]|uniref:Uncharacterized protein n=1 Tax=Catharanthus roseus TaxID=4058 RepID=A0ACC0B9U7_CATRO|nr:hypothetical protein M9H77_19272 [Catharanthus roseus]